MLNYITKAAFKTKINCYQLVHHVTSMFSSAAFLLPPIIRSLSYITFWFRLLSWNFSWTQNTGLWRGKDCINNFIL